MPTPQRQIDELRDEVTALRAEVRALTDRAAIAELIDRFSRDLDEYTAEGKAFDATWVRSYFTEDADVAYPPGSATGAEAIATLIGGTGMAPFRRAHHVTTNYVLRLQGDRATVRFNLVATHVRHDGDLFTVGDVYRGDLARTPGGWRFARQGLDVTWTDGPPPGPTDRAPQDADVTPP